MTTMTRGVAVIAVAASMLTGCATQNTRTPAPTSTAPESAGATPRGSQFLDEAPAVLEDGRHPVMLTSIDVSGRAITFDLIVFLTGAEAKTEFAKRYPGEDGPMNDYFVVNDNPRLRTLPVSAVVAVKVVDGDPTTPVVIAFGDLPGHGGPIDSRPFWITVTKGEVNLIEEQFLP